MSGLDVMKKVNANNQNFKTMSFEVLMTITRGKQTRERNFYNLKKYDGIVTKSLIKFYLPANIKGTSLLTHSYEKKNEKNQWIYLPALKSLSQIKGDKKKESFMGSDYTYSDVAGRQLYEDTHTLVKKDKKYYYIKSVPKDKNDLYSQINLTVKRKHPVVSKAVFFTKKGKLKTLTNDPKSLRKIGPMYFFKRSIVVNNRTKGSTELELSAVKRNIPISDSDLGIKGLKD
ncbi:MAG: outer membrane lipoprotein-sorting protein [Bacteriovoracales bacterium]|nr:outer membrane lipoprotein-sorting protein [Bacteriovoracales bacterium]